MDVLRNGTIRCRDAVYSVQGLIGSGRFSRVYHATDTVADVGVAIKALISDGRSDYRKPFLKELGTLNALKDSPLRARYVDVMNAVRLKSGAVCFVMERLGTTLHAVLHNIGPLPMSMCRPIVRQIAQGTAFVRRDARRFTVAPSLILENINQQLLLLLFYWIIITIG